MKWAVVMLLLLCGCTIGSSTTERPALARPAIEPDGAFWDAADSARRGDREAFMYCLSPQMVYRALFPAKPLKPVTTQAEFDAQREVIAAELAPHAQVINGMADRYMAELDALLRDQFIEASRPRYEILFRDSFSRADGPNFAYVIVSVYPKHALPDGFKPETMEVRFIQDGRRWLIDEFGNDKLKGAFVR